MSEHTQQSQPDPAAFSDPAGQPHRRTGDVVMIAVVWLLVVAVTASVGWFVVDRAGGSLLEASGLGFAASSGSGAPTSAVTTGADTSSASLSTSGGRVAAVCTAKGIALQYATPAQGWRMQVEDTRPDRLRVEFEKGGESSKKVEVEGRCVAGTPHLTQGGPTGADDASSPSAPATADDHGGGSGSGQGGGSDDGSGSGSGKASSGSGSGGGGSDDGGGDDSGGSGKGSGGSGQTSGGGSGGSGSSGGGSGSSGGSGKSSGGSDDNSGSGDH